MNAWVISCSSYDLLFKVAITNAKVRWQVIFRVTVWLSVPSIRVHICISYFLWLNSRFQMSYLTTISYLFASEMLFHFFKIDTRRDVSESEIFKSSKSYSSDLLSSNQTTWFVRKIRYLISSLCTDHSGQSGKPEINPIDWKDKKRRVCSSCLFLHQCKSLGLRYSGCIF